MTPATKSLNLSRIVERLQRERQVDAQQLAQDLGVRPRTLRKYVQDLREHFEPWRDARGSRLDTATLRGRHTLRLRPPVPDDTEVTDWLAEVLAWAFADGQLGVLCPLLKSLVERTRAELDHVGERASYAVARVLRRDLGHRVLYLPDAPLVRPIPPEVLLPCLSGVVYSRQLRLDYHPANGDPGFRLVQPLSLVHHRDALHLLARYPGSPNVRHFALSRVRHVEFDAQHFPYPDDYDPRHHYRRAFGVFVTDTDPVLVRLRVAPVQWLQTRLRERQWHPDQTFVDLPDGRLELRFPVASLAEVEPWARQFGDLVEVLAPPQLVAALRHPTPQLTPFQPRTP